MPRFESFDMPRITRGFLATVPAISPLDRSERPRGAEGLLGEERSTPLLSPRVQSCRRLCHLLGTRRVGILSQIHPARWMVRSDYWNSESLFFVFTHIGSSQENLALGA